MTSKKDSESKSRVKSTTARSESTVKSLRVERPTLRDVSKLAGVSVMTASRVTTDPNLVHPATRDRVSKAIADLGYVPDRAAGSLASRRSGLVALIMPTLTNSNFSTMAHGLTEVLRESNYQLLIAYTDYSLDEEEIQLRNLLARRPETIVLTGVVHSRTVSQLLLRSHTPIIEVADLPSHPIHHAVGFSNYQVGQMAAEYLIRQGFTRIGAVASVSDGDVCDHRGNERMRGFEDRLKIAGLSTNLILRQGAPPVSYRHGASAIATLLTRDPRIEAVFAVSDLSAVGVVMECGRRGIAIPDQLSVMGFGDFEIGRECNPPITTIQADFRELGQRTGRLILDILSGHHTGAPELFDIGISLLERQSVGGLARENERLRLENRMLKEERDSLGRIDIQNSQEV